MSDALWYLGRGTGVVSLVLLTLVVALGIAARSGRPLPGLPRFAVAAVHGGCALTAVAFVGVHVLTLLADPHAQLDLVALIVPFTAAANPFWYGLGALALDLLLALVVTSLLRTHLAPRAWRAVHWLAYGCWPVALLHGLGSGTDHASGWLIGTALACAGCLLAAVCWRISQRFSEAGSGAERVHPGRPHATRPPTGAHR